MQVAEKPSEPRQFALVANVSVIITLISTLGMVGMVVFLAQGSGESYLEQLINLRLSQEKILPVMVVVGLFLLATAGFVTWIIVLYSSFRVAGPLFRIASNVQGVIDNDGFNPIPVRTDDYLQDEASKLSQAIRLIHDHHQELNHLLLAIEHLNADDEGMDTEVQQLQHALRQLEQRVKL